MKPFNSSIRVIITLTIVAMGLQGLALALISSDIYREDAINNHKATIEKMVNIKTGQLMHDLTNKSRDLGLSQQQELEFKSALKNKDAKAITEILNSNFHRYFVTAGILKLEKLMILNLDFSILAESNEGDTTLLENAIPCSNILNTARLAKGANRLKIKSGICEVDEKTYHMVITPIGGLSIKGYTVIVTDPVNNLLSIGKDLGMSMRFIYGNGVEIYKSDNWDKIKNTKDFLLTDYHLKTNTEKNELRDNHDHLVTKFDKTHSHYESGLHIEIIENIEPLYNKLPNTRALIITSASIVTLIAIIIALIIMHKTTLNPLRKITKHLSLIGKDNKQLSEKFEVKGTSEICQLAISFNDMAAQMDTLYGKMEEMAYTDQLTSLPNRHMFNETLHKIIDNLQSSGKGFALLMMDLNKFKPINDSLGHKVGDKVLQEVGNRLKIVLRKSDNVLTIENENTSTEEEDSIARLGGDEFTAIITDIANVNNAKVVAEKIIHVMQETLEIDQHRLNISISIGIALCPQDADTDIELLHKADIAMYYAKNNKQHYAFYDESMKGISN